MEKRYDEGLFLHSRRIPYPGPCFARPSARRVCFVATAALPGTTRCQGRRWCTRNTGRYFRSPRSRSCGQTGRARTIANAMPPGGCCGMCDESIGGGGPDTAICTAGTGGASDGASPPCHGGCGGHGEVVGKGVEWLAELPCRTILSPIPGSVRLPSEAIVAEGIAPQIAKGPLRVADMDRLTAHYWPGLEIRHPWPSQRLAVNALSGRPGGGAGCVSAHVRICEGGPG